MGRKVYMMVFGMVWGGILALGVMAQPAQAVSLGDSGIDISGFVDVYYSYNFHDPAEPAGGPDFEQALRAFDTEANEFSLSLAELVVQKAPAPVGFRIDFDYGPTTDIVHFFEPSGTEIFKNVQQAYVTYVAPVGKGLTIDFGKFVTHMGFEVIESKDNWNYSRGLLFTWAIPFYHTGLRIGYPVADGVTVTLLGVNGWNNVDENNDGKTVGAQVIVTAIPKVTFIQNAIWGSEAAPNSQRHVYDTVVILNATDKLSLGANFDIGMDDNSLGTAVTPGDSSFYGVAGYGRLALTDASAIAVRGEWFKDTDGFMTLTNQSVAEVTVTGEVKLGGSLLTRLEYRRDWSNKNVFFDGTGAATRSAQDTITLGAVYIF